MMNEKNFKDQIAEVVVKLGYNQYRDYSVVSVQDEFDTAIEKIQKHSAKDSLNPELLIKYSAQLTAANEVLDAYKMIGAIATDLKEANIELMCKTAYKAMIEIASIFDVPVSTKEKALDNVKSVAKESADMAKDVVRGTLNFGFGILKDTLSMTTAVVGGAVAGANAAVNNKK